MATLIDHKAKWHLNCYKRVTNILFYMDIKTEKRHMIKVFQKKKALCVGVACVGRPKTRKSESQPECTNSSAVHTSSVSVHFDETFFLFLSNGI